MSDENMEEAVKERTTACMKLLAATGADQAQLRYCEEEEPTIWMAAALFMREGEEIWQAAGGMNPIEAVFELAEKLLDGGTCTSCNKGMGLSDTWDDRPMPMEAQICWWKYDPTLKTFIRGCDKKPAGERPDDGGS